MNPWVGKHFVKGLFYTPNSKLDPFRQIFRHTGQSAWAPSPETWPTTVSVSICTLPYCSGSAVCPPQSPPPVFMGVAANLPSFPSTTTWGEVINLAFLSGCCFLNQIRIYPNIYTQGWGGESRRELHYIHKSVEEECLCSMSHGFMDLCTCRTAGA